MDLNRLTRWLVPIVVLAVATGCSSTGGQDDGDTGEQNPPNSEESTVSPFEGVADPVALEIQPPAGFVADDAIVREVPMSEAVNTYTFKVDGGSGTGLLMISTYVLDEAVDESNYQGVVNLIREYDARFGHEYTAENDRRTLAVGRSGFGMLTGYEDGGTKVVQQNHYFFESAHAIQVTCQWTNSEFSAVYAGCKQLLETFPFPEGWDS